MGRAGQTDSSSTIPLRFKSGSGGVLARVRTKPPLIQHKRCTVVINAVNEANSDLGVVVGHEDDVKQLLAVRVELPQSVVDVHQRLKSYAVITARV